MLQQLRALPERQLGDDLQIAHPVVQGAQRLVAYASCLLRDALLDELRPNGWQFDDELLELLWMLEASLDALPNATALLEEVLAGPIFLTAELPTPSNAERRGPGAVDAGDLPLFEAAGIDMADALADDE